MHCRCPITRPTSISGHLTKCRVALANQRRSKSDDAQHAKQAGLALPSLVILFGASLSLAFTAMTGSIGNSLIAVVLDLAAFCYLILAVRVTLSYVRHGPRDRREREAV